MTPARLLADCHARGILLAIDPNGGLAVDAPRGKLTPELLEQLREAKPALLALLLAPEAESAAAPEAPAWPDPSPRDLANAQAALLAFYPEAKTATPTTDRCRCGCSTWTDVAIHGGASTRRDCAGCGRFREFVQWHGRRFDN